MYRRNKLIASNALFRDGTSFSTVALVSSKSESSSLPTLFSDSSLPTLFSDYDVINLAKFRHCYIIINGNIFFEVEIRYLRPITN